MSNKIEINLLEYNYEYFQTIRELIVPNFQLIVSLTPLNEIIEDSERFNISKASNCIGKFHTNAFANLINDLKSHCKETDISTGNINLIFESSTNNFDVSIIGVIAIFNNTFPNIKCNITIPKDIEDEAFYKFRDILLCLRNWYHESNGISLFGIYYTGKLNMRQYNEPRGLLPILLLTPDSYNKYFIQKSNIVDFTKLFGNIDKVEMLNIIKIQFDKHKIKESKKIEKLEESKKIHKKKDPTIAETNYRIIRDTVKYFKDRVDWQDNQRAFFQHYILMLSNFDLLIESVSQSSKLDFSTVPFKSFRKAYLSTEDMKELQNAVNKIRSKLCDEPLFLSLLFSILVNRNIDKRIKNSKLFVQRLDELYEYSNNLFLGIKEIARNIIDHTQSKIGVICGKESTGGTLFEINNDFFISNETKLAKYFQNLSSARYNLLSQNIQNEPFLQITIFDEGQQGIIQKTIENIKTLIGKIEDKEHLFNKDLKDLNSGLIKFYQFFNTKEFLLSHQSYKASSHWGLVSFTNLINRNYGLITASSKSYFNNNSYDKCLTHSNNTEEIVDSKNDFTFGTKFDIILPIGKTVPLAQKKLSNIAPKGLNFSAENYLKLFKFDYVDSQEQISNKEIDYLYNFPVCKYLELSSEDDYRKEYDIAERIGTTIRSVYEIHKNIIPILDFENTNDFIDHSKLLRFLGALQLELEIDSLIIINIKAEIVLGLNTIMNLNNSKTDNMRNWNQDHFILIYSYNEDVDKNRIYYTDILGGATIKEYKLLKNKLSSTHSTIINYKFSVGSSVFSKETKIGFEKSQLFVENTGIVKNFEMLLIHNGKTFFECSLIYNLNANIQEIQYGYSGYKIENSHFKLGSKTHIKDFIYAKRIFQNSFFTDRFAFIITKYLLNKYPTKKSLTIIGYGEYSQMLINRVEKLLRVYLKTDQINHNMVSDAEKPYFIKNEDFKENVIVIVPINTTLSTTIKIEDLVSNKIISDNRTGSCRLLDPSLNLILVTHKDLENQIYVDSLNDYLKSPNTDNNSDFPYKFFYWKNVNIKDKIVLLGTNPTTKGVTKEERYFVSIKSEWYLPEKCESCFPKWDDNDDLFRNGIFSERPLLETDKTSVTPDLLLDLPASYSINENYKDEDIFIPQECYLANHILFKNNHYQNFIDPFPFFSSYKDKIELWASSWRLRLYDCLPELFDASILLIAPSERNNTYFIELINRVIFNDSAVIIHYEVSGDYTENYQKFFSANIKQSNYIFYVDDIIQSGKTFHLVNNFIRYCNNLEGFEIKERIKNKTCDGVFTLISKTDKYAKSDIVAEIYPNRKIEEHYRYNSFFYLSVNSIINEKCPICIEYKKYLTLADNSILDTVKHYFLDKSDDFNIEEVKSFSTLENSWLKYHPLVTEFMILPWKECSSKKSKDLYLYYNTVDLPNINYIKLLIQHLLNNIISSNLEIRKQFEFDFQSLQLHEKQIYIDKLFQSIIDEIRHCNPFRDWYNNFSIYVSSIFDTILEEILIKALTVHPFSNIRFIKEKTFFWLTNKLDESIDDFIQNQKLDFNKFRKIKFLLKRLSVLGSNYIIRKNALLKFRDIYKIYTSEVKERIESRRLTQILLLNKEFEIILEFEANLLSEIEILKGRSLSEDLVKASEFITKANDIKIMLYELESKKKYIIQAIRNIHYIEVSLKEFSYFFVAIVKEVTSNNDYKILKLEQNIKDIMPLLNQTVESDFCFLMRLLKYENVILVKKTLEILYYDFLFRNPILYFNNRFSQVDVRKLLDEKFITAIEDYRLSAFKQYLAIDNVITWKEKNHVEYLHILELLYLYSCLINEKDDDFEKPNEFKLENKTKTILQNFFRIASDNNYEEHIVTSKTPIIYNDKKESGAFLVLKYIENGSIIEPFHLIVAYATKPNNLEEDYEILNAPFDNESLSLFMINGINNRKDFVIENIPTITNWIKNQENHPKALQIDVGYPQKPWTIWEINKRVSGQQSIWQSSSGAIYPINNQSDKKDIIFSYDDKDCLSISNDFTENLYLSDKLKSIVFIRLAKVSLKSKMIKYDSKAIITLFSDSESFEVDRLKFPLILLPQITSFLEKHYDSDSLKAFIEERNEKIEVTRLKHGFQRYLDKLKEQIFLPPDKNPDPDFVEVIYNLLIPWQTLKSYITEYKLSFINIGAKLRDSPSLISCTINEVFEKIYKIFFIIIRNELGGYAEAIEGSIQDCKPIFEIDKQKIISISLPLFEVIIAEAIINVKKDRSGSAKYFLTCRFFKDENNLVMLELTNDCNRNEDKFIKRLNKQNKNSKHGLGLINYISTEVFSKSILVKIIKNDFIEEYKFSLCFPLTKIVI